MPNQLARVIPDDAHCVLRKVVVWMWPALKMQTTPPSMDNRVRQVVGFVRRCDCCYDMLIHRLPAVHTSIVVVSNVDVAGNIDDQAIGILELAIAGASAAEGREVLTV